MIDSTDQGSGLLHALAVSKDWDTAYGAIDMFASVTLSDIDAIGYGTSSTAASNYSDFAAYDRQRPRAGVSNFETETAIKFRLNCSKDFFSGYQTKVSLFATGPTDQSVF